MMLFEVLITDMMVICDESESENIMLGSVRLGPDWKKHPLGQTSRQPHCTEISVQQHLPFVPISLWEIPIHYAGCHPTLMHQILLSQNILLKVFQLVGKFFDLKKSHFVDLFTDFSNVPTFLACLTIFLTFNHPFGANIDVDVDGLQGTAFASCP